MAEDRLQQAIELVQSGSIDAAREQLEMIIKGDRHNVAAWHWYAQTWSKDSEKIRVWEACLRYNPENQLAQEALKDLKFVQSRKTNPAIQVPVRRIRPQTNPSQWLVWLSIGLLAAVAVFAWVAVRNSAPKDPQQYRHVQPVEYYLYVPDDYSADEEWPLFVGIHGAGGTGLDCWNLWQSYADNEGFILLCPSIPGFPDGFYQDVGESTVWSAVGEVKKEYRVRQRMFLAGFSAGAFFIQGFTDHYPSYVSGLSILSSGLYLNPNAFAELVPILLVIGDQDHARAVQTSQQFVGQLRQYGFDVKYELMPGVGHAVTRDGADLTIELFRKTVSRK
ncbi:MAG TPA: hypothetical protein VGK56_01940 [Anaerolineales bacterium]